MTSTWGRFAVAAVQRRWLRIVLEMATAVAVAIMGLLTFDGRPLLWAMFASAAVAVVLIEVDHWWGARYPVPDRSDVEWHRRFGRLRLAIVVPVVVFLAFAAWLVGGDDSVWVGFGLVWGVVVVTTVGEWLLRKRLTT